MVAFFLARKALGIAVLVVALFLLAQLVPYRVSNPSTRDEPAWSSPAVRDLAVRACFDCHSNQTKTPWYAQVAPISWWTTNHVQDGRAALNFDEWTTQRGEREGAETVTDGSMPPSYYTWFGLHQSAKLTAAERAQLAAEIQRLEAQAGGR